MKKTLLLFAALATAFGCGGGGDNGKKTPPKTAYHLTATRGLTATGGASPVYTGSTLTGLASVDADSNIQLTTESGTTPIPFGAPAQYLYGGSDGVYAGSMNFDTGYGSVVRSATGAIKPFPASSIEGMEGGKVAIRTSSDSGTSLYDPATDTSLPLNGDDSYMLNLGLNHVLLDTFSVFPALDRAMKMVETVLPPRERHKMVAEAALAAANASFTKPASRGGDGVTSYAVGTIGSEKRVPLKMPDGYKGCFIASIDDRNTNTDHPEGVAVGVAYKGDAEHPTSTIMVWDCASGVATPAKRADGTDLSVSAAIYVGDGTLRSLVYSFVSGAYGFDSVHHVVVDGVDARVSDIVSGLGTQWYPELSRDGSTILVRDWMSGTLTTYKLAKALGAA